MSKRKSLIVLRARVVGRPNDIKREAAYVRRNDPENYRTGAGTGGPRQTVPVLTKAQRKRIKGN